MKDIKKIILLALIAVWFVFSFSYIIRDQWQDYKINQLEKAYKAGGSNAVITIISEAKKCQPVPLFNNDEKISIIAVECLKQTQNNSMIQE